jgi:adenine-specific DNA-methyltransferase
MNYLWSKLSLLQFIEQSIGQVVDREDYVFSDLFAGTGIVGRYFKEKGHKVIANDLQYYSYVLNENYIGNHADLYFTWLVTEIPELFETPIEDRKQLVCTYLEQLHGKQWYIYRNYCAGGTVHAEHQRQYFSDENGQKCDAIRTKIEERKQENKLTSNEYYFLLATLIEAIDKVANTASVYGAFLKQLKKSAQKPLQMKPAEFRKNEQEHQVFNKDINTLINTTTHDVVYLDPPYNHRQYAGNYHILETIAKYDNPQISWKTWMRDCSNQTSSYSKRSQVRTAFKELITTIDAKYVFLSYNDEWLLSLHDIKEIMSSRGEYGYFTQEYGRFKADKDENRTYKKKSVTEYIHWVKIAA